MQQVKIKGFEASLLFFFLFSSACEKNLKMLKRKEKSVGFTLCKKNIFPAKKRLAT
jgi:hypothetical protein